MSFVPLDQLIALQFNKAATVVPSTPGKRMQSDAAPAKG